MVTCNPVEEVDASRRTEAKPNYTVVVVTRKRHKYTKPTVACKITVGNADLEPCKKTLAIV